jgi:hypothetical protein
MLVRTYTDSDLAEIKRLHEASGFTYTLPDPADKSFFSCRVVSDGSQIRMAAFLRATAEPFLICDTEWSTAAWRDLALRKLQAVCREDCVNKGIGEVNAFLPPEIAARFGKRLLRMGWKRYENQEWPCYGFEVMRG